MKSKIQIIMKNIYFTFLLTSFFSTLYCQSFQLLWSDVGNVSGVIKSAAVNPKDNNLYFVGDGHMFGNIYKFDKVTGNHSLFFSFPKPNQLPGTLDELAEFAVVVEKIAFDNQNNLIFYGRTHNENLGTTGVYSPTPFPPTFYSGHSFICKINQSGTIVWFTYFHDLLQNKNSLTIDNQNNIYVLNLRHKTQSLSPNTFQQNSDLNSKTEYQTVISKISPNGNHIWSTFYFNDNSDLYSIEAGTNGVYVYGVYKGFNQLNNFFSTVNSFQPLPGLTSSNSFNSKVFLSKFNTNGQRIWSTYYGNRTTSSPTTYLHFQNSLLVINDEPYIITTHHYDIQLHTSNMATNDAFMKKPIHNFQNNTLTKFNQNGIREWCTYLYCGSGIDKTTYNDLMLIGELFVEDEDKKYITSNSHQSLHGGNKDMYLSIISNDGKQLKYGSFYGYEGVESGSILTFENGYYIFGSTSGNLLKTNNFSTSNQEFYGNSPGHYWGRFTSAFQYNTLSDNKTTQNNIKTFLYPNPAIDVINISSEGSFLTNTQFTIYDINGKKVITQKYNNDNHHSIKISNLNPGVYILQIKGDGINQSHKFIKK